MDAAITDKDLIYFYFEMIKKSGALNVLDVGDVLKKNRCCIQTSYGV